jgi:hypothetical protein
MKMEVEREFKKSMFADKKVRQHPDGRISVFFVEGVQLHTIFLKSDNLRRNVVARRLGEPKEIASDSLYEWVNWEEV